MFNKKEKKDNKAQEEQFRIKTIPEAFYGGADPEIYHEKKTPAVKVETEMKKKQESQKKENEAPKVAPAPVKSTKVQAIKPPVPATPQVRKKTKKWPYFLMVLLFVVVVAAISWYYIDQARQNVQPPTEITAPEEEEIPVVEEEEEPEEEAPVIEDEPVPTSTPSLEVEPLVFPVSILTDSVDSDDDSLTDMEEEVFGTDPNIWDNDEDGYYDGQEIYNLYSPSGFAPTKLIDSGLIREYVNPTWRYRLYYPESWEVGVVDEEAKQILFSAITGDYIEVRVVEKDPSESFGSWFARNAIEQQFDDLESFSNRFQEECRWREDSLVAYFVRDNLVFVLIYHPGTTGNIPYRHIMQMIIQSFRPVATDVQIPEQEVLILPPTTSEDGVTTGTEENI